MCLNNKPTNLIMILEYVLRLFFRLSYTFLVFIFKPDEEDKIFLMLNQNKAYINKLNFILILFKK